MEFGILPTLTKPYLLSYITEEQIFEKYLGIQVDTNGLFKAPPVLRASDRDPTCSFYYSTNGKPRLRDWAGYFHGDCFDLVAYIIHVDASSKKGFNIVLDQIARDFHLHKYSDGVFSGNTIDIREGLDYKFTKKSTVITFQARTWTKQDADFWKAGNMTKADMEKARIYPCLYVWINNQVIYNFNPSDPAYAYMFTPTDIKVYFPFRKKFRFITNSSYLQGIDLLEPDLFGLVTKSYKDVTSMRTFSVQAVAPGAESIPLTRDQWFILKHTCDHWFSLMDFDRQGVVMANQLRKSYPIHPLFFGSNRFPKFSNTHYKVFKNVKDFYDFVKVYGKDATYQLIEEAKYYFSKEVDDYDNYMNENLGFIKAA